MEEREIHEQVIGKLLRSRDKVEALSWLTVDENNTLRELSHADSVALVVAVYELGATEVVAVQIGVHPPYESTKTLIATLPQEAAKRRALFDWHNRYFKGDGYDDEVDWGQHHLLIWFD